MLNPAVILPLIASIILLAVPFILFCLREKVGRRAPMIASTLATGTTIAIMSTLNRAEDNTAVLFLFFSMVMSVALTALSVSRFYANIRFKTQTQNKA